MAKLSEIAMERKREREMDGYHLPTGAGFRNHPQKCLSKKWFSWENIDLETVGFSHELWYFHMIFSTLMRLWHPKMQSFDLPSGKHNYGKSPFSMG